MRSIFEEELREKKQQRHALRAKTSGKRKKAGSMLPIDFMSKAQQKEYTKAGEIMITNLWDEIITLEQYNELSDEKKKNALEHWRKVHSTAAIRKKFGWNSNKTYKEFERLGIQVQKRVHKNPRKGTTTAAQTQKPAANIKEEAALQKIQQQIEQREEAATTGAIVGTWLPQQESGSTFYLDDTLKSEEAITKLMKYAAFLEGEKNKFRLRVEIKEVK